MTLMNQTSLTVGELVPQRSDKLTRSEIDAPPLAGLPALNP
jgi:hypothetical protein